MTDRPDSPYVLLAGGGSGGHIFPNIAIAERLAEKGLAARYVVSNRPLDAKICQAQGLSFEAVPAMPLGVKPKAFLKFVQGFKATTDQIQALIDTHRPEAVVATGGFVSGPVAAAAAKRGVPVALVSLDAVPGKANRLAKRWATQVFSVFDTPLLPDATTVGMPLRRASVPGADQTTAKAALNLPADHHILLVTAGSQGLASTNDMLLGLARQHGDLLQGRQPESADHQPKPWHILHLTGQRDHAKVQAGYAETGTSATVLPFCDQMGMAWCAADIAISLAGAGSVAEAWANAVPTVFFPYPHHKDQHQRLNALPIVGTGGAVLSMDSLNTEANVARLVGPLSQLINSPDRRDTMRQTLQQTAPPDGAQTIANWASPRK